MNLKLIMIAYLSLGSLKAITSDETATSILNSLYVKSQLDFHLKIIKTARDLANKGNYLALLTPEVKNSLQRIASFKRRLAAQKKRTIDEGLEKISHDAKRIKTNSNVVNAYLPSVKNSIDTINLDNCPGITALLTPPRSAEKK